MNYTKEQQDLTRKAKLLEYANAERNKGGFNDITIQVGAESISANRMILSCYSKYFESMFRSNMTESYQNTVKIKEADGETTKKVIDYIYSGTIHINKSNVMLLLKTVDFLQVDDLKKDCFKFLETSLTVESCLDLLEVSYLYSYPSPLRHAYQFISDNFIEVTQTDKFKNLSKQETITIFENLDRTLVRETAIYTATINWVKHDHNRKADFLFLFFNLNLQNLSSEFILATIAQEPLVKERNECTNAVLDHLPSKAEEETKMKNEKRQSVSKILCIGGYNIKSTTEVYNISGNADTLYPDLPYNLSSHCSIKFNDFIYCIGGVTEKNNSNPTNKVYRLDLKAANLQWEKIASMNEQRCDFGAVRWGLKLIVSGGYNGVTLSTTELYEPGFDQWKSIAKMNVVRNEHALVVADNKLFAIGGSNNIYALLSSVEQLDSLDGNWKQIKSMNQPRSCLAATVCNNFIYAIGGWSQGKSQKTVEKYDLEDHEWRYVRNMNVGRRRHKACVLDGKIFVIGGINEQHKTVQTIECYDPAKDKWIEIGKTGEFYNHALVTL